MKFYKKTIFLFFLILFVGSSVIYASDNGDVINSDIQDSLSPTEQAINEQTSYTEKNIKTESKTIVLNSTNFKNYVTDSKFNENISEGDTIDVDGKLDSPNFDLTINKAVNIISSKNNSYISLNSSSNPIEKLNGNLKIIKEGSGTNITGLYFYNTHIRLENTTNIHIDNITFINEKRSIGSGVGAVSVRDGTENVSITNSYFKTEQNGGHSNVVFAVAYNCLFENNTIEGYGNNIGNLFYLTTYNVDETITPYTNINITIRNNNIRSINTSKDTAICVGMVLEGRGHIIENNIINRTGTAIMSQYSDKDYNTTTELAEVQFINNTIFEGTASLSFPGIIANNTFNAFAGISKANSYNNQFTNATISKTIFSNNTANHILINGDNVLITNNTIRSTSNNSIDIQSGTNITISNNILSSMYGRGDSSVAEYENSTVENNTETYKILYINDDNSATFSISKNNLSFYPNPELIRDGDWINFKLTTNNYIYLYVNTNYVNTNTENMLFNNLTIFNLTAKDNPRLSSIHFLRNHTFINCSIYAGPIVNMPYNFEVDDLQAKLTLNNSILTSIGSSNNLEIESYNSFNLQNSTLTDNNTINGEDLVLYPRQSTYYTAVSYISPVNGTLLARVVDGANLHIVYFNGTRTDKVFIDRPVNLIGFKEECLNLTKDKIGTIEYDVIFAPGSEGSNISDCKINGKLILNTSNINAYNNIIRDGVIINNTMNNNLYNNTINDKVIIEESYETIFNNNIVNTNEEFCINTDCDDTNKITNNILKAQQRLGDDAVNSTEAIVENNTPLYSVDISLEIQDTVSVDEVITPTITVINNQTHENVNEGYVELYLNGEYITNETLNNGIATPTITIPPTSQALIKAWYIPTDKYQTASTTKTLQITKQNITINIEPFTAKVNENTTITVNIESTNNDTINEGTIEFNRLNQTINVVNNQANITFLVTEEYKTNPSIKLTYNATDKYNSATLTLNLNPTKGDIVITKESVTVNENQKIITLSVKNILNQPVNSITLTITDKNQNTLTTNKTNSNGEATITLNDTNIDTITITSKENFYYLGLTQDMDISLPKIETITTITIPPTAITNTPVELKATVNDIDGNPLNTGTITFTKDDETIATTQVTDGTATATATFTTEEDTTITATYTPASTEYATSTAEASISIQKPQTVLNIEDVTLTAGKTVTLTATLTDQLGNNITGGKVVFKVNGKTVKDTKGKVVYAKVVDGVAQVEYTVPTTYADKELNITATYTGTITYNKETTTITKTATKPAPTLTITPITNDVQSGSTIKIEAKVSTDDNPITTGKIVFKLNGKTLKDENGKVIYAKVDANGTVSLDYNIGNLKVNTYNLTATFIANGYDKLEANTTINVVKA